MGNTEPNSAPLTRRQRWIKYGLNVGVLVLALVLILSIVNFIAYQKRQRLDFTHNRRYTLSPQTLRALNRLDRKVTITSLYRQGTGLGEMLAEVDSLLAEYDLRGKNVEVGHIDPARDVGKYEKFTAELLGRYGDKVETHRKIVADSKATLAQVKAVFQEQGTALTDLLVAFPKADEAFTKSIEGLNSFFVRSVRDLTTLEKEIDQKFAGDRPDFEQVRPLIQGTLDTYSKQALDPAVEFFTRYINRDTTPDAAKDKLMGLRDQYRKLNGAVEKTLEAIGKMEFGKYEEVKSQLERQNCVVVMVENPAKPSAVEGEKKVEDADHRGVAVLSVDEMYPEYLTREKAGGAQRPEQTYKGEEAITGALLKLTLEHKSRVVFVNPSPMPVLMGRMGQGQDGYGVVAQRLRAMNFEVEEWQPGGGQMFGQRTPPQPRPEPKAGEMLIFISLPADPPNPQMPVNPAADLAADAVKEHMKAGRPALVMSMPASPLVTPGESGSVLASLKEYGLTVEAEKLVVIPMPGRERGGINQWEMAVTGDHPIVKAVRGMPGLLIASQPVVIEKKEGVEAWPLVQSPEKSWAEGQAFPMTQQTIATMTQDLGEAEGPITVGAAVKKGDQRLVVVADPMWASDQVTSASQQVLSGGDGIAQISLYPRFPGNAELFVNSVYWLAGLDDLIAPGAKAQETRRLDVSVAAVNAYRWLLGLGLPAACLAAGVVVWFVRRR